MIYTNLEDTADGGLVIHRQQDVTDILEENKRLFNYNSGYNKSGSMKRAASIPMIIVEKWQRELGVNAMDPNDWPAVKKLLNSSEWRYLRTAEGHL
jgi:hypothetical protein